LILNIPTALQRQQVFNIFIPFCSSTTTIALNSKAGLLQVRTWALLYL
jgi:hypothetical protein